MPRDPRDYKLELSSVPLTPVEPKASTIGQGRPSISVLFACCNVYVRVYRSPDAMSYLAHCPKCAKSVRFEVGDDGTDARSFVVH